MTAWAVAFTLWLCPGAISVLGFSVPMVRLPDSLKPALGAVGACQAMPTVELYDPARKAAARARVLALGQPAQLYQVHGVKVGPSAVDWKTTAIIKENLE